MRDSALCRELLRKIAKDLGATPFSLNKAGLTHPDLLVRKAPLKVSDEEGLVRTIPMWYGEALGLEGTTCCLLVALDDNLESLEIAAVIGFKGFEGELQKDSVQFGFRYDWSSETDPGILMMKFGEKWLPLTMAQKLQLALGFEVMVQDGVPWNVSPNVPEELRKNLSQIIEVDGEG